MKTRKRKGRPVPLVTGVESAMFGLHNYAAATYPEEREDLRRCHLLTTLGAAAETISRIRESIMEAPGRHIVRNVPSFVQRFAEQAEASMALEKGCEIVRAASVEDRREVLEDVAFHFGYVAHGRFSRPLTEELPVERRLGEAADLEGASGAFIGDLVRKGEAEREKDLAAFRAETCSECPFGGFGGTAVDCTTCVEGRA